MRKIIILYMSLLFVYSYTQTLPLNETSTLDDKLVNIDKSSITSGILYQRSSIFTRLYDFNKSTNFNTANASFFEQSLNDLYYGSNQTKFIDFQNLRAKIAGAKYRVNYVDIGIINTPFHLLYYDEDNPSTGGLSYNNNTNLFVKNNNGKPAFVELFTTIVSPLKKEVKGSPVIFTFKNDLIFTNGNKTIKNLTADFGDGSIKSIISNGTLLLASCRVAYSNSGDKKITFNITYSDNTSLITYGNFYFQSINESGTNSKNLCNGETLTNDYSIISDTEFKGYDEPFAFKGKFDYRILYHTNNGNTEKKLLKPIIIVDGFDPGDKRKIFGCEMTNYKQGETFSIQDMMTYPYEENGITKYKDLIQELRNKGYDVTIVNHPTYCVSNEAPYNIVNCGSNNSREIDGGADYIERNALTLATLIKNLNSELRANNSTEKLAIVGPSMGGQTSRYALSYLEKLGIDHNTRLWISVDSPHLGANIPLGDQALINLLATTGKIVEAADFYDKQLGSPAARQQLIEFHRDNPSHHQVNLNNLNGRTTSQGFSSNSGNSFFQQFYNNQFTNGLPNSKGYPINLRKIALSNGSLSGKTIGNDSEKVLNIRGFQRINISLGIFGNITFPIHIASLESHFMPTYNIGNQRISRFKKAFDDRTTIAPNINSRGNMDTVPGGWFAAQKDIKDPILGREPVANGGTFWNSLLGDISDSFGGSYFELREYRPNHSFIPTFSSLGIKNPDRNWAENLQRNLICTGEIPFDSYYGSSENTQHTSFTEESVKWLMKELDGQPQSPWFPINADSFQGVDKLCINQTATYNFTDACKLPSKATWTVSSNLQIVSFTDYSINVKVIYQGQGTITATFQNGQTISKNIHMGGPVSYMGNCNPYDATCTVNNYVLSSQSKNCITFETIGTDSTTNYNTDYEWEKVSGNYTFLSDGFPSCLDYPNVSNNGTKSTGKLAVISPIVWGTAPVVVKVRAKSSCGWGPWQNLFFYKPNSIKNIAKDSVLFTISPNPSDDFIMISKTDKNNTPTKSEINAELYNSLGTKQRSITFNDNGGILSVQGLLQGVYILKLIYDDKTESHQIIVK